jgi:hypothetical protein
MQAVENTTTCRSTIGSSRQAGREPGQPGEHLISEAAHARPLFVGLRENILELPSTSVFACFACLRHEKI